MGVRGSACPSGASWQVGRAAVKAQPPSGMGAAWGHCARWRFGLHCEAPGASCAAQAVAQAWCWGARAARPPRHK